MIILLPVGMNNQSYFLMVLLMSHKQTNSYSVEITEVLSIGLMSSVNVFLL